MYVTKIEPVTKTKYKVFIDGQFAFVIIQRRSLSRYHIAQDDRGGREAGQSDSQ